MTATIQHEDRADAVLLPLKLLLQLWKQEGTFDIVIPEWGGYRYGPIDEAKQEELFRTKQSKAKTLRQTPHGRRCAVDAWPVGFNPNRGFDHPSNVGMLDKFKAWGAFVDKHGPRLRIRWGGHFKGFGIYGDMPHAEIIFWDTRYQFPSGEPVLQSVPITKE